MITKANTGVKDQPRLGIKPRSPNPQPVVIPMSNDVPWLHSLLVNFDPIILWQLDFISWPFINLYPINSWTDLKVWKECLEVFRLEGFQSLKPSTVISILPFLMWPRKKELWCTFWHTIGQSFSTFSQWIPRYKDGITSPQPHVQYYEASVELEQIYQKPQIFCLI